jgi:CSLREA domain-containing protein
MNTNALIPYTSFLRLSLLTFFISLVLSLSAASAGGATFTVTKTADTSDGACNADCSLREAVLAANAINSDEIINFDPAVFGAFTTITLTAGELSIEDRGSLTINGTGSSHLTITSNLTSRIFGTFDGPFANGWVTLNNMTIAHGNSAPNFTGGCIFNDGPDLNINNSIIRDCRAGSGAGIFNSSGLITIANSAFTGNIAESGSGAAIFNGASDPDGGLTVTNTTFAGNHATNEGGAIETGVGRHTQLTNVTIAFNSAGDGGGVHNSFNQAVTTIRNTIIAQNSATLTAPDAWGEITSQGYNLIQNTSNTTILGDTTGNIIGQKSPARPCSGQRGPNAHQRPSPGKPGDRYGRPGQRPAS